MEQNTTAKNKLNYPILLLLIVTLLRVKELFGGQRTIPISLPFLPPYITRYFAIPAFLVLPLLVLVLWRDRFEKAKSPKILVGLLLITGAVCTFISSSGNLRFLLQMLGRGGMDLMKVAIEFFAPCMSILQIVLFVFTALMILLNVKSYPVHCLHRTLCGFSILLALFLGITAVMYRRGDILSILGYVLTPLALWYVPKVLQDRTSAEITKMKLGVLIIVVALTLVLFVAAGGTGKSSSGGSGSTNTCGSCDRSWPAGDDGGNYMNIAKTGLCKNCESNYHSLKGLLDNEN